MTPASANNYILYRDSQNVQRRKYQTYCPDCGVEKYVPKCLLKENRRCKKCTILLNSNNEERNKRIGDTLRQKYKDDAEFKRRVFAAKVVKRGKDHWNWKGGITPLTQRTRTSEEANAWKLAVLHRDNYACRVCQSKDNLHAHHINSWAEFPEDRYILENGLTLCHSCHTQYHTYAKEVKKNLTTIK